MDKIIRATAGDGFIKMAVISATETVERARAIHNTSPTASAALGRTLCAASLMGQAQKEEKATLTIRINGGGPIGSVVAVSDCDGNVRGYVGDPSVDLPLRSDGKLNVGGAVGRDGMLTVSRDLGMREPYIGSVELLSGEIAEDVTRYLTESEQVPSACALGVLVDTDCTVRAAGGFIVQLMPGAEMEMIEKLEDNIFMMDQLTTILDEDGAEEIFAQVLKGFEYHLVGEYPVEYRCYCSRERIEEAISCIEKAELEEMAAEGKDVSASCQFCDAEYSFTPEELLAIAAKKIEEN
ncbi:MAG: Hsp33 family molecular chaperone HslO [Oscillospiraceae bacterium]|nr:Hsp33 family molecular chaperone HslO [Oscillospiraceae bacterium]